MARPYLGHLRISDGLREEQTLKEHSHNTGLYAAENLQGIGLFHVGLLAGYLHDFGKARFLFLNYLLNAAAGESVTRGSVNHSFAGCQYFLNIRKDTNRTDWEKLTAELLAYACGAHHGLFDCIDERRHSGFHHRQTNAEIDFSQTMKNFFDECFSEKEIKQLFQFAVEELVPVIEQIEELPNAKIDLELADSEFNFFIGLLERMILSAVIDGDRRDTAEFMNKVVYPSFPAGEARKAMWEDCMNFMEKKLGQFPQETPIQKMRRKISDQCVSFANHSGGIFRLNVPTGGGKTLTSLRFALAHAMEHNKDRIILTSSLLSVLDQNAKIIRDFLPNQDIIIEHHSNVVHSDGQNQQEFWEQLTEQWSSPIIITTLVQFLNTLFSGKGSCIRRFHSLANSVIVMDEVQTIPGNLLSMFNLAINFLTSICGATVVLCSATQPYFEAANHPVAYTPIDLVPRDNTIWEVFQRTNITDAGSFRMEELPEWIGSVLQSTNSLLVICNTKSEAAKLFQSLSFSDAICFHLSAAMCMEHRRDVLKRMKKAMEVPNQKVLCISTQVIEAGVDISFGCVIRLLAGMDSIVQAAGRCNRNRESETPAPVYVVRCTDEKLTMLRDIQWGQRATIALLNKFAKQPDSLEYDLSSDKAIRHYYQKLYADMPDHYQDDIVDGVSVYDLLSNNETYADEECTYSGQYFLQQAFQKAGDLFSVFDDNTWDVLAPYVPEDDESISGREIRTKLIAMNESGHWNFEEIEGLLQNAKQYSISLYNYQKVKLDNCGGLLPLFNGRVHVLLDGFYDPKVGFTFEETCWEV